MYINSFLCELNVFLKKLKSLPTTLIPIGLLVHGVEFWLMRLWSVDGTLAETTLHGIWCRPSFTCFHAQTCEKELTKACLQITSLYLKY